MPVDSRATHLKDELDRRYLVYADTLPAHLAKLAKETSTFVGRPTSKIFQGPSELNQGLVGVPWMFWEQFAELEDDLFLDLGEAGAMLMMAGSVLDHLVDEQTQGAGPAALIHQALLAAAVEKFRRVFPASGWFWEQYVRLGDEHLLGYAIELDSQVSPHQLTIQRFKQMASGKLTPIIITVAAFLERLNRRKLLGPIERSVRELAIASALLDDISDWEADLKEGHRTFFLDQVDSFLRDPETGQIPTLEIIRARINQEWLDFEWLGQVLILFEMSLAAIAEIECSAWVAYITRYQQATRRYRKAILARNISRRAQEGAWD